MTDRTKRTYRLDGDTIQLIDWLSDNSQFDKQEVVERAVKYYYRDYRDDNLRDPAMSSVLDDDIDLPGDDGNSDGDNGGVLGRLRGN